MWPWYKKFLVGLGLLALFAGILTPLIIWPWLGLASPFVVAGVFISAMLGEAAEDFLEDRRFDRAERRRGND